jgi:hypothetical protein
MISRLFATFVEYRFTDMVNGKDVNLYRRKDGTYFLAHSRFDAIFFYVNLS